jgi:hypothetical protein
MEAQGDEGTVRHRRKFVVLGTALPAASEARHSGHRLAPTGKGLPTRLPRSGLVQPHLSGASQIHQSKIIKVVIWGSVSVLRSLQRTCDSAARRPRPQPGEYGQHRSDCQGQAETGPLRCDAHDQGTDRRTATEDDAVET